MIDKYPLKGSIDSPIIMKGIYFFVNNNRKYICDILTKSIPFRKIINYTERTHFNISNGVNNRFIDSESLRVETRDISSSQGHCNIYDDDRIIYTNECTVMDIVINLYKKELRVDKLNSLLKD